MGCRADMAVVLLVLLSLAPQPSLGLGLLHKIRLNFLEASQQFSFYRIRLAPRPTPIPEGQASVFISPRGRVATHFSRLLRHACVTVGLFLFPVMEIKIPGLARNPTPLVYPVTSYCTTEVSRLTSKNVKVKNYKTVMFNFYVGLGLTLREEK
jgi:hypothetical protein